MNDEQTQLLQNIWRDMGALSRKIDQVHGELSQKIDQVDEKVDHVTTRVEKVEKKVDGLDKKVDALDKKVDALDERTTTGFARAQRQLVILQEGILRLGARMAEVAAKVEVHDLKLQGES